MSRLFDGVNDDINVGSATILDNLYKSNFTVGFWINVVATGGYWISKLETSLFAGWVIFPTGTLAFTYWCYWNDVSSSSRATANNAYATGKWFYLTCTTDGGTNPANYHNYVNGILNDDATTTGTNVKSDAGLNLVFADSHSGNKDSNIYLAHVQFWKAILSVGEIKQSMFYPGSVTRRLVGYWPLFGTSSPEPDYTENKNDGTVTGAVKGTTEPPINGIFRVKKPELITSF